MDSHCPIICCIGDNLFTTSFYSCMDYMGELMKETIEQQCVKFVKDLTNGRYYDTGGIISKAKEIISKICNHDNVEDNEYCNLCGWHNELKDSEGQTCKGCGGSGDVYSGTVTMTCGDCYGTGVI